MQTFVVMFILTSPQKARECWNAHLGFFLTHRTSNNNGLPWQKWWTIESVRIIYHIFLYFSQYFEISWRHEIIFFLISSTFICRPLGLCCLGGRTIHTTIAAPPLEKLTGLDLVKKFHEFYGTWGSLPHSQAAATYRYPEPMPSNPCLSISLLEDAF